LTEMLNFAAKLQKIVGFSHYLIKKEYICN